MSDVIDAVSVTAGHLQRRRIVRAALLAPLALSPAAADSAEAPERPGRVVDLSRIGARGDGRSDDTAVFLRGLEMARGGVLQVPPGTFRIQAGRAAMPPETTLLGMGRGCVLSKVGPGTLLEISGLSTSNRLGGCLLRDLVLDGDGQAGALVHAQFSQDIVFDNVWSRNNDGVGFDAVELWDSRFINCTWDWCSGSDGSSPSVLLRNKMSDDVADGDCTNALYFVNCRWESFRDGALWMRKVGGASASQVHLCNCKMESAFVRGSFLRLSRDARNVSVTNLYMCGTAFDRGWSGSVDLIDFQPFSQARVENVAVWLNGPVARTVVRAEPGHPSCLLSDIWVDGPSAPTHAILEQIGLTRATTQRIGFVKPTSTAVIL